MRKDSEIAALIFVLSCLLALYYINQIPDTPGLSEPRPLSMFLPEGSEDSLRDCRPSPSQIISAPSASLGETTCSEYSHLRGGKQKVVSFSYYERNKTLSEKRILTGMVDRNVFLDGLEINIGLLARLYPGQ